MSYSGQSPTAKRVRFTPQSTDPENPQDGDFFYADGTSRTEGLYVYSGGDWQVVSSAAADTFDKLVLTPQSSDPGTPSAGEVFYSDGTPRAEGLWVYNGSEWVQLNNALKYDEFYFNDTFSVRVASTANVTLASAVENGDTMDGVVLATGNFVLLKNQTTATENGVYTVNASGAPTRHSSFDSAAELSLASIVADSGTANAGKCFVQNNILSSLSDDQSWSETISALSFTVPAEVYETEIMIVAGGGGGGGGTGNAGGGGGGGAGSVPVIVKAKTTPGETVSITLGKGGAGGAGSAGTGTAGSAGGSTIVTTAAGTYTVTGAAGGSASGSGGTGGVGALTVTGFSTSGGTGGVGSTAANGSASIYASGGTGGGSGGAGQGGGGGGGGGASIIAGGAGTPKVTAGGVNPTSANKGAGGGGGNGGSSSGGLGGTAGFRGGRGGHGYVRISW